MIGEMFGYKVIEDDSVKELRLPKKVIDWLKTIKSSDEEPSHLGFGLNFRGE